MHYLTKAFTGAVKLDSVEAFCCEPGCMKYFSNDQCLKAHIKSCHQHITCEICGTKQVKRNIKRHLQMHEVEVSLVRIKCNHKGCLHTFSNVRYITTDFLHFHLIFQHFYICTTEYHGFSIIFFCTCLYIIRNQISVSTRRLCTSILNLLPVALLVVE
jgi:hypothetical protein